MRRIIYLLILIAGATILASPASHPEIDKKIWQRIDSLESEGLFRSALGLVDQVYRKARETADPETEIRALIYRLKYIQELEEDGQVTAIETLEKELPDDRLVQGSLKNSMLAELYNRYFTANRWQISQNPAEDQGARQPLKNWPPERFYHIILDHYQLSLLNDDQLSKVRVGSLPGLWSGNLADTINKPSLYDVLVGSALNFVQNAGEFSLAALKPAIFFSPDLFSEPGRFIKTVAVADSSNRNPYWQSLKWYGSWLAKKNGKSMFSADLQRLKYVFDQSENLLRDSLYEAGLLRWAAALDGDSAYAEVCEALAQYHLDRGGLFRINDPDTLKYKQERKLAAGWLTKSGTWAATLAGKRCRNLSTALMKSELSVQAEACEVPLKFFPVSIEYRNLSKLKYRIARMNAMSYYTDWNELEAQVKLSRINSLTFMRTGEITLPDDGDLNPHRTISLIDPLPAGFYLIVFWDQSERTANSGLQVIIPVTVSGTTLVTRQGNSKLREYYFRDRDNGSPLAGLKVIPWYTLYDQENRRSVFEKGRVMNSGKDGYLAIPDGGPGRDDPSPKAYRLEIVNKKDTFVTQELFYPGYSPGASAKRTGQVLYTDRSLYKPGDIACFRGVLLDYYGDSIAIHPADSIVLTLQDPKYQVVEQITIHTDSMGVFTGSIKLPYMGLTGAYLIHSKFGQAAIRMEHYRRPAFFIRMDKSTEIFRQGESITITGKVAALSGEPVPGAEIVADVDLSPAYGGGRWSPFAGQKIRITQIRTKTDTNGRFTGHWTAVPEGSSPFGKGSMDRYSATIKATDLNGESHQEEITIDCGKGTTSLSLNIPEGISIKDTLKASISAVCTDGRILGVPVRLKISKLNDPGQTWLEPLLPESDRFTVTREEWQKKLSGLPYRDENKPSAWGVSSVVSEKRYPNDSLTGVALPPAGKWQKGWYKVVLSPVDTLICKSVTRYLYAEDPQPREVPADQTLFARVNLKEARPGDALELTLASYLKGFLMVDLQTKAGEPVTTWYTVDSKTKKLGWPVTAGWQGGAVIRVLMFRSNRVFEKNIGISVPWVNSELKISGFEKLKTVKPGEQVSLNLLVRDELGKPVQASLGVTVYDASLDLIAMHQWTPVNRPYFGGGSPFSPLNTSLAGSFTVIEPATDWIDVASIEPVELNWFGYGYYGISRMEAPMMKMAMARPDALPARGGMEKQVVQAAEEAKDVKVEKNEQSEKTMSGEGGTVIRSDFSETAVFKGNILSDRDGRARLDFTVPDVFTEWKVLATGHDRQLAFGNLEYHFKSSMDLMLKPNFPEFMRKGDTVDLAARTGWYGKDPLRITTSLLLSDSTGNQLRSYTDINSVVNPGDVVPFVWQFSPLKAGSVTYLLKSVSTGASDGLTDTIRIMPDEVRLWNARPFFFARPGSKQLKIDEPPLEAVFEVTTTPAWQILQSLPVVVKPERDCSEYWFSRLYLACLTGNIADHFPAVAKKFLSDSVPAKQRERFNQIRDWMNIDSRARELAYVLEKLSNLQNQDGTWPWFRGLGTDLYMTQQIIAGFGELKAWGVFDISNTQRGNYMVTHAIEAMDKWMYRRFRDVIRADSVHPVQVQLDPMIINYLYARSFYPGLSIGPANEIAWLHFSERIPLEWTRHDPGLQSLMAITSVQSGKMANAVPIFKSLRERAKIDEQWGMYWPRKGSGSSWFEWDLWMQSRMIELFGIMEDGRKDLDQLKMYLIHQKRGRDWGNGLVAAWASKSLLFYGTSQTVQPASVEMTWGKEKYSALRIATGSMGVTGYYRFEWKNPAEMPKSGTMDVTKTDGGPAWGTLFTLNNYTIDKLAATNGPLSLTREAMIRNEQGEWNRLRKGQLIHAGDIIRFRININSESELSYIEINDNLGAGVMPVRMLSGYQYQAGLSWYQSRTPESLVFYIPQLPKGISTIEYQAVVEQAGDYSGGYATATSLYAPEFRGWSDSFRIHARR